MDILCAGQMVADILIQGVEEFDFSVDTRKVQKIALKNGGDCLNTAIDLKRLGNDVGFAGVLGKDTMGEYLHQVLRDNGIDDRGIVVSEKCDTSAVAAVIHPGGERVFLYYGGSNDEFGIEHIDLSLLKTVKMVHVGGTFMLPRFDGDGAACLFREAHKNGVFTSMDVTYDTSGRWMEIIEPSLKDLDLFLPSINEAKHITGSKNPADICRILKEKGVKHVIVKLGSDGCYVDAFGETFGQKAFPVPVVDTTGAGDSFVAGVLTGLNHGWNMKRSVRLASAVAAGCIGSLGATTGVPGLQSAIKFMEK